jgi:antitoxin component of MazEF toxin-antitoxin module
MFLDRIGLRPERRKTMSLTQVVTASANHTVQLPEGFVKQLGIRVGEELIVQLVEEAGLILIFPSRRAPHQAEAEIPASRQQVQQALANAGLLATLDPATVRRYAPLAKQQRLSPLKIGGKPVSEIIVEERGRW